MKKKIAQRALLGAPIGLALSVFITIAISLGVGDGHFYAVVPELIADCKTEINAVLLQTLCSLLYGGAWAGASVIWDQESWSILRQSVTHLAVCSAATFPIAYLMRWMPRNAGGILLYFGIFAGIYFIIWLTQYLTIRARVRQLNEKVEQNRKGAN